MNLSAELYVTTAENESHRLSEQLAANLIRSRITVDVIRDTNRQFYTVYVADEAIDRARRVRCLMFGS